MAAMGEWLYLCLRSKKRENSSSLHGLGGLVTGLCFGFWGVVKVFKIRKINLAGSKKFLTLHSQSKNRRFAWWFSGQKQFFVGVNK